MKTSKFFLPIALALIFLGTSNCALFKKAAVDEGIVLKYDFNLDQDIQVSSSVVSKFNTEQMGQSSSIDINSSNTLCFNALSKGDGVMDLEMEFVKMTQSIESSAVSGDTDYSELLGKKTKFRLDQQGNASDLQGFSELPDISSATGEIVTGEMYEAIAKQVFFRLPDYPVKVGDTWTNEEDSDMPYGGGNLKTESSTVYIVLEKLEVDGKACVKLDVASKSKTSGEFQQGGMDLVMDRNAKTTGHVIFAINEGMFISMKMDSKTNGIIDVPVASVQIIQEITSDTSIEVNLN